MLRKQAVEDQQLISWQWQVMDALPAAYESHVPQLTERVTKGESEVYQFFGGCVQEGVTQQPLMAGPEYPPQQAAAAEAGQGTEPLFVDVYARLPVTDALVNAFACDCTVSWPACLGACPMLCPLCLQHMAL